jgi:hypothetical protein
MGILLTLLSFVFYLALTIIIEVGVTYLMGYRTKNFLMVVALASVITNPSLNLILSVNGMFSIFGATNVLIILLEIIVVFVEFYILCYVFDRKYTRIKLFKLAVIINFASYFIGYYLQVFVF